jgi:hypothetical protein
MPYSRKISQDETLKNAVFIDKSKFPELGKEFKIKFGKKLVSANINAVGDSFYLHLFSSLQFKKGQKVSISKGKKGEFELKVSK